MKLKKERDRNINEETKKIRRAIDKKEEEEKETNLPSVALISRLTSMDSRETLDR